MNIAAIYELSTENGPGVRTSVFVSGCTRHCPGCHNEQAWSFDYGRPYTRDILYYIRATLERADGLSILGGEPFEMVNVRDVANLVINIPWYKSIWMYTGYTYEELINLIEPGRNQEQDSYAHDIDGILDRIDVLVDGPYIESQRDITLAYRGSRNQRIIDVQESLRAGNVVLIDEYMQRPTNYKEKNK